MYLPLMLLDTERLVSKFSQLLCPLCLMINLYGWEMHRGHNFHIATISVLYKAVSLDAVHKCNENVAVYGINITTSRASHHAMSLYLKFTVTVCLRLLPCIIM